MTPASFRADLQLERALPRPFSGPLPIPREWFRPVLWMFCLTLLTGGCVSRPAEAEALIVRPTEMSRDVLAGVVAKALGRDRVLLAPDALTSSPLLVIEPRPMRTIDGLVQGYRLDEVYRFRLLAVSGRCVLERLESDERWPLPDIDCRPTDR